MVLPGGEQRRHMPATREVDEQAMEGFLNVETLTIELLLVASLVAIAVRRLRLPYTVALVLVGLLITFRQPLEVELKIILSLFVPPLIFEAAFHIEFGRLREALLSVLDREDAMALPCNRPSHPRPV